MNELTTSVVVLIVISIIILCINQFVQQPVFKSDLDKSTKSNFLNFLNIKNIPNLGKIEQFAGGEFDFSSYLDNRETESSMASLSTASAVPPLFFSNFIDYDGVLTKSKRARSKAVNQPQTKNEEVTIPRKKQPLELKLPFKGLANKPKTDIDKSSTKKTESPKSTANVTVKTKKATANGKLNIPLVCVTANGTPTKKDTPIKTSTSTKKNTSTEKGKGTMTKKNKVQKILKFNNDSIVNQFQIIAPYHSCMVSKNYPKVFKNSSKFTLALLIKLNIWPLKHSYMYTLINGHKSEVTNPCVVLNVDNPGIIVKANGSTAENCCQFNHSISKNKYYMYIIIYNYNRLTIVFEQNVTKYCTNYQQEKFETPSNLYIGPNQMASSQKCNLDITLAYYPYVLEEKMANKVYNKLKTRLIDVHKQKAAQLSNEMEPESKYPNKIKKSPRKIKKSSDDTEDDVNDDRNLDQKSDRSSKSNFDLNLDDNNEDDNNEDGDDNENDKVDEDEYSNKRMINLSDKKTSEKKNGPKAKNFNFTIELFKNLTHNRSI